MDPTLFLAPKLRVIQLQVALLAHVQLCEVNFEGVR